MVEKTRQIKTGFYYLSATLLETLVPFITLPIFTRILSVEDYGALALAQIYGLLAGGLVNFGMITAYNRNYFEHCADHKQSGRLFFSTLLFVMLTAVCGWGITLGFREPLAKLMTLPDRYTELIVWAFIGNSLINWRMFFLTYLRNEEQSRRYVGNTIFLAILTLGLSVYFVVGLRAGVVGLLWGQVMASGIIFVILMIQFLKELPLGLSLAILVDELKIGAPMTPMAFLSVLSNHFDKYMLGALATMGGVGVYSVGQKIAMVIYMFMTSLQNVYSPPVYRKMFERKPESPAEIGRYLLPFIYLIMALALGICLFSEEMVWFLLPPKFYGAVDVIIISSLFYAILFFGKINADQLAYARKTHLTTFLLIGVAGLTVLISIPLIRLWGAIGAATGMLLARSIAGTAIFKVAQHHYRIIWRGRELGLIFGILFTGALGLLALRMGEIPYPVRLGFKLCCLCVYAVVGSRIGILTRDNWSALLSALPFQIRSKIQEQR